MLYPSNRGGQKFGLPLLRADYASRLISRPGSRVEDANKATNTQTSSEIRHAFTKKQISMEPAHVRGVRVG
eukprot:scaffold99529_cov63-Phaeocystis_antarctica.AAC.1